MEFVIFNTCHLIFSVVGIDPPFSQDRAFSALVFAASLLLCTFIHPVTVQFGALGAALASVRCRLKIVA